MPAGFLTCCGLEDFSHITAWAQLMQRLPLEKNYTGIMRKYIQKSILSEKDNVVSIHIAVTVLVGNRPRRTKAHSGNAPYQASHNDA
jgi:hypothetical protein